MRKLSEKRISEAMERINRRARVNRDELVEFMLNGGYSSLPAVPQHIIDSPLVREDMGIKGYVIPDACLGRKGTATYEQAESIRLWIKKHLTPELGEEVNKVSVVPIQVKDEIHLELFRKV